MKLFLLSTTLLAFAAHAQLNIPAFGPRQPSSVQRANGQKVRHISIQIL
jgi:hypothetical protein